MKESVEAIPIANRNKSLHGQHHILSNAQQQIEILEHCQNNQTQLSSFQQKLQQSGLFPFRPTGAQVLQINMGKMCNQVCEHCHVDAGPDRKEIMTRETMSQCIEALKNNPSLHTVDLTGGAPEMNPHFRWFVEEIRNLERHIIVRCNLTIILANKKYHDLPEFYQTNKIELVCSLPCYTQDTTDKQRGNHVFEKSIRALQLLNAIGYGKEGSGLLLKLVYNPSGAFLPPSQPELEQEYEVELWKRFTIEFNHLLTMTNIPISRFLDYLLKTGSYDGYMQRLVNAYNPAAAANVMCRNTISIGWDGFLYDCDFNQMLEMKMATKSKHISHFSLNEINNRDILTGQHCFGCTAGAGSSCGGTVVN